MDKLKLCMSLAEANKEIEVENILKDAGYWDKEDCWFDYGENENNFATIGNQQSKAEAAIVEKIINSVDAVLMAECLSRKIDPTSENAPRSLTDALEQFFNIIEGRLSNISPAERSNLSKKIAFVATGARSNPCYSIIDTGEGQSPDEFIETFLSLGKSNKLRIPFVQGKFNMGGTGVMHFCGTKKIQLLISKRNNKIVEDNNEKWGFTVIRREYPKNGVKSSSYRYLAPNKNILSFCADGLNLLPGHYPNPLGSKLESGTFIKLYEYQMEGLKTNILLDLYNRLSLLMPSIALPIRLYERRVGYEANSYESTLAGLSVRLKDDRSENLEKEFNPPPTSSFIVDGENIKIAIYVFKKGQSKKYTKNEGVIFTINGQTHGYLTKSFFARKSVGMAYLADSILLIADCSEINGRTREDLFMNSRDRLRSGELKSKIEKELSDLIKNHQGLKRLREKRRREETENRLTDSKPMAEIIQKIINVSPTLNKLFIKGERISSPYNLNAAGITLDYKGKRFPSFFKLKKEFNSNHPKIGFKNHTVRLQYLTDVENNYFNRDNEAGDFTLFLGDNEYSYYSINLWNGTANLNIKLPQDAKNGEVLKFKSKVIDIQRSLPITEEFYILVDERTKLVDGKPGNRIPPSSNNKGAGNLREEKLALPNMIEVYEEEWDKHKFTKESALKVLEYEGGYDFYINMNNCYLLNEKKNRLGVNHRLLEAKYKYGMTLVGLALLNDSQKIQTETSEQENESDIANKIAAITESLSPILLPMIQSLGELEEADIHYDYEEDE